MRRQSSLPPSKELNNISNDSNNSINKFRFRGISVNTVGKPGWKF